MVRVRRAGRKGVREEPAFTSLKFAPARTWRIGAGCGAHPLSGIGMRGTLGWLTRACPGGHEEGLRRTRGDAAGTESGSSSVERITVNTGTVPVLLVAAHPVWSAGWVHPPPHGAGGAREPPIGRGGAEPP